MDATPILFDSADAQPALAARWYALQDAAGAVALLAGLDRLPLPAELRGLPILLDRAPDWRRAAIERAIDDLAAIMEPGIAALLAVRNHGIDATVPALALWSEFAAARDALVAMLPIETDA